MLLLPYQCFCLLTRSAAPHKHLTLWGPFLFKPLELSSDTAYAHVPAYALCLCLCLCLCLSVCLSVSLCLSISLSVYLSVSLCLSVYLSLSLSHTHTHRCTCTCTCLQTHTERKQKGKKKRKKLTWTPGTAEVCTGVLKRANIRKLKALTSRPPQRTNIINPMEYSQDKSKNQTKTRQKGVILEPRFPTEQD